VTGLLTFGETIGKADAVTLKPYSLTEDGVRRSAD